MQVREFGTVLVLVISLGLAGCGSTARSESVEALAQGKKLYEQSCAACHGIEGEGQPDWKQPNADSPEIFHQSPVLEHSSHSGLDAVHFRPPTERSADGGVGGRQ